MKPINTVDSQSKTLHLNLLSTEPWRGKIKVVKLSELIASALALIFVFIKITFSETNYVLSVLQALTSALIMKSAMTEVLMRVYYCFVK